jgi:hypothetical protein
LTRSTPKDPNPKLNYKTVDYHDRASLTTALKGHDVCLSFLVVHLDTNSTTQKNLVHACIAAGVRRFAPSEWGIKNESGIEPYANKDEMARYLASLAESNQLGGLEYCLFQPSIFMDYFAHPYPLAPELITWPFFLDFNNRRALILDDGEQPLVITAIQDDAEMLKLAIEDDRPWPTVGGIRGCRTTTAELFSLAQKLRPGDWKVEHVSSEDIRRGELKSSWVPRMSHPVIPEEDREEYSVQFVIMFFTGILNGAWDVSDEWNQRFPDFKFQSAEEYLTKAWEGKP